MTSREEWEDARREKRALRRALSELGDRKTAFRLRDADAIMEEAEAAGFIIGKRERQFTLFPDLLTADGIVVQRKRRGEWRVVDGHKESPVAYHRSLFTDDQNNFLQWSDNWYIHEMKWATRTKHNTIHDFISELKDKAQGKTSVKAARAESPPVPEA